MGIQDYFVRQWQESRLVVLGMALICISVILLVVAVLVPESWADLKSTAYAVATGALGGGVFAWITKVAQLSGVFRDELEAIIYGERHLAKRLDKEQLWLNATRSLYGDRFPGIRDRLTDDTLETVWPSSKRFYLSNVRHYAKLSVADRKSGYVLVEQAIHFDVITDAGGGVVERDSWYNVGIEGLSDEEIEKLIEDSRSRYTNVSDPSDEVVDEVANRRIEDGFLEVDYVAKLKSNSRYTVSERTTDRQLLSCDCMIGFSAISYVDGLVVTLDYDESELDVQFYARGPVEFHDCEPNITTIHKESSELLFRGHGFLAAIQMQMG